MAAGPSLVYLWVGDTFLTERKYQTLLLGLKQKDPDSTATQTFSLSETPLEKILSEARTLPFLISSQVFRLQASERLKEKNMEALANYFQNPSPSTYLVFESAELEKDSSLAALISKHGQVQFLDSQEKKSAGQSLIKEKLRRAGKTLEPSALARLEEQMGDAPAFLSSVLDQLIAYTGTETQVTEATVEAFQENWKEADAFALTDAIANRNPAKALLLLKQLVDSPDELISLLGLLHWQIRRLWQARVLLDDGESEGIIIKKCRLSPKQMSFFMRQVKNFSRKKLEYSLEKLFELDWKIKTGQAEGAIALEAWAVQTTT